ncbi:MAG TPA: urease accessory UreF family protein [Stellaceae bacterium]|jgi:urease accessory protein|nr:urease accessory UreF family protein [Stellaceae bacterium]
MTTITDPGTDPGTNPGTLYRLLAWLSPGFPTGAFSYSHGLEAAVESGAVHDRMTLQAWITAIVTQGSGRTDADILRDAFRAAARGDAAAVADANARAAAFRPSGELALETSQQGGAFLATYRAAWDAPHPYLLPACGETERPVAQRWEGEGPLPSTGVCHAVAFGAAAAGAGVALGDALLGYLQAFAANLMSAGLRLGVVGQTNGQRILAALEPAIIAAAQAASTRHPADFGSATFAADLASTAHETQYTRLFRS